MSKHTPGPWTVATPGKSIKGPDKKSIAAIVANAGRTNRPFEEREANARLIAAVPEMLQLIWDLRVQLGRMGANADVNHPLRQAWVDCNQMIEKVTGGPK